jgi:hypothetical protein
MARPPLLPQAERRFAQILAQWIWNLRLELGQQLSAASLCTTEFASAFEGEPASTSEPVPAEPPTPLVIYGPPQWARPSFTHGFSGSAFTPQPDGTLRCPANHPLYPQERRPERDGSLRILYAARIGHCRFCPLRAQCQESRTTIKPRRVSAVVWPLAASHSEASPTRTDATDTPEPLAAAPVLWKDWPRCGIRRAWRLRATLRTTQPRLATWCFWDRDSPSSLISHRGPCHLAVSLAI